MGVCSRGIDDSIDGEQIRTLTKISKRKKRVNTEVPLNASTDGMTGGVGQYF